MLTETEKQLVKAIVAGHGLETVVGLFFEGRASLFDVRGAHAVASKIFGEIGDCLMDHGAEIGEAIALNSAEFGDCVKKASDRFRQSESIADSSES